MSCKSIAKNEISMCSLHFWLLDLGCVIAYLLQQVMKINNWSQDHNRTLILRIWMSVAWYHHDSFNGSPSYLTIVGQFCNLANATAFNLSSPISLFFFFNRRKCVHCVGHSCFFGASLPFMVRFTHIYVTVISLKKNRNQKPVHKCFLFCCGVVVISVVVNIFNSCCWKLLQQYPYNCTSYSLNYCSFRIPLKSFVPMLCLSDLFSVCVMILWGLCPLATDNCFSVLPFHTWAHI